MHLRIKKKYIESLFLELFIIWLNVGHAYKFVWTDVTQTTDYALN